jgi:hypothetical protein
MARPATHRSALLAGLGPAPSAHGHPFRHQQPRQWLDVARRLHVVCARHYRVSSGCLYLHIAGHAFTNHVRGCALGNARLLLFGHRLCVLRQQSRHRIQPSRIGSHTQPQTDVSPTSRLGTGRGLLAFSPWTAVSRNTLARAGDSRLPIVRRHSSFASVRSVLDTVHCSSGNRSP